MMRRWFPAVGCGALALALMSPSTSSAQFFLGLGNIGMLGRYYYPGMWYPPSVGYNYNIPSGMGYNSTTYYNTPLYYGAGLGMGGMNRPVGYASYGTGYGGYPMGAGYSGYTVNYSPAPALAYYGAMPAIAPAAYSRPAADDRTAVINVRLPGTAQLRFDGARTRQTGRERTFTTPALDKGKTFHYDVEATWMKDGKPVTEKQTVAIRAGSHVSVVFPKPKS